MVVEASLLLLPDVRHLISPASSQKLPELRVRPCTPPYDPCVLNKSSEVCVRGGGRGKKEAGGGGGGEHRLEYPLLFLPNIHSDPPSSSPTLTYPYAPSTRNPA